METIPKSECQNIGFFRKTHGIHGSLVLEYEPQFEFSIEETNRFFVELEGLLVPFFIKKDGLRFRTTHTAVVDLDWVDSEKYAKRLVGNPVYLFKYEIIDIEEESADSSLVNYFLSDEHEEEIGTILHVDDFSGNVVLTVNYKGEEVMIPYNENLLVEVDHSLKTLKLKLPEGLFET
jgi:16S rRNA processing protein RimM